MRIPKTYPLLLVLTTLSVIGTAAVIFCTGWGIGLSPDSAVYIGAARNLLSGKGLSVFFYPGGLTPMTHYPPLYPALLAGIGIFGIDPLDGARWLSALFFAANIAIVGFILYSATLSLWASALGSVLMMGSLPMVQIHSVAWSEPIFIFFGLLGIFLLALYIERPVRFLLAAASVAVALGFLARYAGIALVAAGALGTLLLSKKACRQNLVDTAIFCLLSCLPISVWITRNLVVAGNATNRKFGFHLPTVEHVEATLETVSAWFLPSLIPLSTRWAILLLVAGLLILAYRLTQKEIRQNKIREGTPQGFSSFRPLLLLFIVIYGFLLFGSIIFLDAHTPVDNRILSPVYVSTLVLGVSLAANFLSPAMVGRGGRLAVIILAVVFAVSNLGEAIPWLKLSYQHGIGYAGRAWKESQLVEYVETLDSSVPIFTNGPDAVYMLTGRSTYMIPRKLDPGTSRVNAGYSYELASVKKQLEEQNGVLVYFNTVPWRWYLPSENELKEQLRLRLLAREEDGSIYQMREGEGSVSGN